MPTPTPPGQRIGVVVPTYRAADYIAGCLESLVASGHDLRIVVVDNASPDRTDQAVLDWASGRVPFAPPADWPLPPAMPVAKPLSLGLAEDPQAAEAVVTLLRSPVNGGFAHAVNAGLRLLMQDDSIAWFWVLNPDTVVEPQTPAALARKAASMERFAVIGSRALYYANPARIQADAGCLHPLAFTGVSLNQGALAAETAMPDPATVQYIPGVSMLVSRAFIAEAGLMDERYFLYYEEIDWQLRRGSLPLAFEPEARVLHRAGASIGSGSVDRAASPLSVYFMCRNLLPFVARWSPWRLPFAYAMAWAKLVRHWRGSPERLEAFLRGLHGFAPPSALRRQLPPEAWTARLRDLARPELRSGFSG